MCASMLRLGLGVDHRADVGGQAVRVADAQFAPCAPCSISQHPVGDVFLHAQHAQRRAALAGAVEGRGDARRRPPARRAPTSRRSSRSGRRSRRSAESGWPSASSRPASVRCSRRATSVEPVNITPWTRGVGRPARRRPFRRGPAAAAARRAARRPRAAGATACGGDQRRLLGRLGEHRVAGGQRGGDLAGEDRQREVPRADADDRAERRLAWRCRSRRAPARRSSAGSRPPRALRRSRSPAVLPASRTSSAISAWHVGLQQRRRRARASRARSAGGVAAQAGAPSARMSRAASTSPAVGFASRGRPRRAWSAGLQHRLRLRRRRRPAPAAARARHCAVAVPRSACDSGASRRSLARSMPARVAALSAVQVARQRDAPGAAGRPAFRGGHALRPARPDRRPARRCEIDWSAMRLTNEVLAPFSSSRRTR